MFACNHRFSQSWSVTEPEEFWNNELSTTVALFSFPHRPKANFYCTLETDKEDSYWTLAKLSCEDQSIKDDVFCLLWAEANGNVLRKCFMTTEASKDHPVKLNEAAHFCHGYCPFVLNCTIVFKKNCPFCIDEQKRKEIESLKRELRKRNFEYNALVVNYNKLATYINDMPDGINSAVMWKMREENKLTDFALRVKDGLINVHKNVLASKSSFFAEMFEKNSQKTECTIDGTNFEALKSMVEFMYLGKADKLDVQASELFDLANWFQVPNLGNKCLATLQTGLSTEKVARLLILSIQEKDNEMIRIVLMFIKQYGNISQLALSNAFSDLLRTDVHMYTEVMKALIH